MEIGIFPKKSNESVIFLIQVLFFYFSTYSVGVIHDFSTKIEKIRDFRLKNLASESFSLKLFDFE